MWKTKIFTLILLLAVMTVISGCGKKEVKTVVEDDNQEINQEQNNNQEVEDQKEQNGEIEDIATSTNKIDISDWQTYRNEEYGFELKYPKTGWAYKTPAYGKQAERSDYVHHVLGLAQGEFHGDWSILVSVAPKAIDDLLSDYNYYWNIHWKMKNKEKVVFGTIEAESVTWSNNTKVIYIQNENKTLTVAFDGYQNEYFSNKEFRMTVDSAIEQIIKSFKFIN